MTRRGRLPGTTKAFRDDPDRFAVALAAVLIRIHGHPTEKATRLIAAWFHARMVDVTRCKDGMVQVGFAFGPTTPDGKAMLRALRLAGGDDLDVAIVSYGQAPASLTKLVRKSGFADRR